MSQHNTRWPSSAKATARLSVVVVFATPPFWLANAITLQLAVTGGSDACVGNSYAPVFARRRRNPPCRNPPLCWGVVPVLLDRRLVFVTGKAPGPRSTVANP